MYPMIHAGVWALVGVMLAGSALCWVLAARRFQAGLELIPWVERRPAPWGLADVAACFILLIIFDAASLQMVGLDTDTELSQLDARQQTRALGAMALGRLGVAGVSLMILLVRTSAQQDVGVTRRRLGADAMLGTAGFLMVAPPIYLLQIFLSRIWPNASHPLVEVVRQSPQVPLFAAACATAVVAAPLAEELLLRVVFQGWLEKIAVWRGPTWPLLLGGTIDTEHGEWGQSGHKVQPLQLRPPFWPVVVSALLFALMHVQKEPSPDPIPLFFFALALGYIYQRTHRLMPCVVMHMLLNSASMFALGLSVWWPDLIPAGL